MSRRRKCAVSRGDRCNDDRGSGGAGQRLPGGVEMFETYYESMRRQGISRRSFLKFCSLTAASLGLSEAGAQQIVQAMQSKPRTPVIWLEGLECTCCSESFIRSSHPLAKDVVLSTLSLDYHMTLSAAAGQQLRQNALDTIAKHKGNYILAVEGNPPLG